MFDPGDVFERDFVEVSDPWHDRFPGHSQIAASLGIIVPRIGFPGNETGVGFRSYPHVPLDNYRLFQIYGYVNGGNPHGSLRPPQLLFSA